MQQTKISLHWCSYKYADDSTWPAASLVEATNRDGPHNDPPAYSPILLRA
jgi:hypothetical protein